MNKIYVALASVGCVAAMPLLAQPARHDPAPKMHSVHGEIVLYQQVNYNGESEVIDYARGTVHTDWPIRSISVHPGDRWQICARPRYRDCIVLTRNVADATMIGITNQVGSIRPAPAETAATPPQGN
jgi:hypothetical protein